MEGMGEARERVWARQKAWRDVYDFAKSADS